MTGDRVFRSFLESQGERGAELAANSDVLSLYPLGHVPGPPRRYVARYSCTGVVRNAAGEIATAADDFTVGITLSDDHLRHVDPLTVITWLTPFNVVHPNISPPYVCCGRLWPGIELVDLLLHVYDLICYYNWSSGDALNEEAAAWARGHQHLFPVERRPLRRRKRRSHSKGDDA